MTTASKPPTKKDFMANNNTHSSNDLPDSSFNNTWVLHCYLMASYIGE